MFLVQFPGMRVELPGVQGDSALLAQPTRGGMPSLPTSLTIAWEAHCLASLGTSLHHVSKLLHHSDLCGVCRGT